jgi:ribosomal protein L16/L10AE
VGANQSIMTVKFQATDQRMRIIKSALRLAVNKLPGEKIVTVSPIKKK